MNTIRSYENRYYNPISIPDYSILEIYKDNISQDNFLGYTIIPLKDMSPQEIETNMIDRAYELKPSGYPNLKMLYGRERKSFKNKRVFAVWYKTTEPNYPEAPVYTEPLPPVETDYGFNTIVIENAGAADTDVQLILSTEKKGDVEVYINDDYYSIKIDKIPRESNEITINNKGVLYNGRPYDNFTFATVPTLRKGTNKIKVSKSLVKKVKVDYTPVF